MGSFLVMLGLVIRGLRRSLVADAAVSGVVGALIAFVLAIVVDGRVDGASFQLRASYQERVRLPEQLQAVGDDNQGLRFLEVVGMRVQPVRRGTSRNPVLDDVDVTRTRTTTVMIVASDMSRVPQFLGWNVPDRVGESAVLLDKATAHFLGLERGGRVALITLLSGIDVAPIAVEVTELTEPYADPDRPAVVRGLLILPESLLQPSERDAFFAADRSVVDVYHTVLYGASGSPSGGSHSTKPSLALDSLTGGDITSEARLGSIGVAFFGALMWILFGARSDRRTRVQSSRVRGLMIALGGRPSAVTRAHMTVILIRMVVGALAAATLAHLAFPVLLGSYSQGLMIGVLMFYLLVISIPNLLWSIAIDRRSRLKIFRELYAEGE